MYSLPLCLLAVGGWLFSVILGVSTNSLFGMWFAMELNTMTFVVLILFQTSEGPWVAIKYFLIQSFSSLIFLGGSLVSSSVVFGSYFMVIGLLFKMAMAPFQFWLIKMIKDLSWEVFFWLASVQKVLPLVALLSLNFNSLLWFIYLGALWAIWGGLTSRHLKVTLVYSSILANSWMLASSTILSAMIFLTMYSLGFFLLSSSSLIYEKSAMGYMSSKEKFTDFLAVISSIFTMSGMPPFLGFYGKIMILASLIQYQSKETAFFLLMASACFLWPYMRIILAISTWAGPWTGIKTPISLWLLSMLVAIALLPMGLMMILRVFAELWFLLQ